jgi:ribonucleoside-diphosphate reductase alpha chain
VRDARRAHVPDAYIKRVIQFARQGATEIAFDTYDTDWDGEAYRTVSGQNSNNSVRVTDAFLRAVEGDGDWDLNWRNPPGVAKTVKARAFGTRSAMPPGPPPTPASSSTPPSTTGTPARIRARSGPPTRARSTCSSTTRRAIWPRSTCCSSASPETGGFDADSFEHAVRLWTLVLEISVLMAQFPSRRIAELSYEFRTLGLGFANLGGLLMSSGLSYDSDEARAPVRRHLGADDRHRLCHVGRDGGRARRLPGLCRQSRRHAQGDAQPCPRRLRAGRRLRELEHPPVALDHANCPDPDLVARARAAWDRAVTLGEAHGYRNAQATVIAPTGTIGLVMDCDTTGIEPDFALVKFKKLAGGGYFKIINQSVPEALRVLGYSPDQISDIVTYAVGRGSLSGRAGRQPRHLKAKGFGAAEIAAVEQNLASAFDIKFVFNRWTLGEDFCRDTLKLSPTSLPIPPSTSSPASAFPGPTSRPPTCSCAAP